MIHKFKLIQNELEISCHHENLLPLNLYFFHVQYSFDRKTLNTSNSLHNFGQVLTICVAICIFSTK